MDKIIVAISGLGLVWFIYWFFFGKKDNIGLASNGRINVIVDGGYKPSVIKIKKRQTTTISLSRKDSNSCLEEFVFPDFKIKKYLPIGERVDIKIIPKKSGEFGFHCGMNMFHGKVIVE